MNSDPESELVLDESDDIEDVLPIESEIVPETVDEVNAVPQGVKVPPKFLEAHYYFLYGGEYFYSSVVT